MHECAVRIELSCTCQMINSLIVIVACKICGSEIVMGHEQVRVYVESFSNVFTVGVFTCCFPGYKICLGVIRVDTYCLESFSLRLFKSTQGVVACSQCAMRMA